jgi:hypothetical protein
VWGNWPLMECKAGSFCPFQWISSALYGWWSNVISFHLTFILVVHWIEIFRKFFVYWLLSPTMILSPWWKSAFPTCSFFRFQFSIRCFYKGHI